jgi:histidinol dehydrogenase
MIKILNINGNIEKLKAEMLDSNQIDNKEVRESVIDIINAVRKNGDKALRKLTKKFDKADLEELEVTEDEIMKAYEIVPDRILAILEEAAGNIEAYHKKQLEKTWIDTDKEGIILGRKVSAIENAGVYVPGGLAPLPSSVLMNIIPAKVAGVENIVMCTPPDKDGKIAPVILAAAGIAGADRVFKLGGAQAIAAMAFGTESVPKSDKIVGPGNIYVSIAKKEVFGYCDIDMFAGPSDILIIADDDAELEFIAADFLSQAEHDVMAKSVAIVFDTEKAEKLSREIERQAKELTRYEIVKESLENNGLILIADDMDSAIDVSNILAPEHLELMVKEPFKYLNSIKNAGAIFMGYYSSEPLGDYFAGPNHVLPTNGSARFFSPLGTEQFLKKSSIISYDREALMTVADRIEDFALAEGLDAHANAIRIRKGKKEK